MPWNVVERLRGSPQELEGKLMAMSKEELTAEDDKGWSLVHYLFYYGLYEMGNRLCIKWQLEMDFTELRTTIAKSKKDYNKTATLDYLTRVDPNIAHLDSWECKVCYNRYFPGLDTTSSSQMWAVDCTPTMSHTLCFMCLSQLDECPYCRAKIEDCKVIKM